MCLFLESVLSLLEVAREYNETSASNDETGSANQDGSLVERKVPDL